MTPSTLDLQSLKRVAETQKAAHENNLCPVCNFNMGYRHKYGCELKGQFEKSFTPTVVLELLSRLERAREVVKEFNEVMSENDSLRSQVERMRDAAIEYMNHSFCECDYENCEACAVDSQVRAGLKVAVFPEAYLPTEPGGGTNG